MAEFVNIAVALDWHSILLIVGAGGLAAALVIQLFRRPHQSPTPEILRRRALTVARGGGVRRN